MDRREMLKGAAAAMTGLTVVNDQLVATGGAFSLDTRPREPMPDFNEEWLKYVAYDPVAVLEAMREQFPHNVDLQICELGYRPIWWKQGLERGGGIANLQLERPDPHYLPDFVSAVRWLHEQAAAADAEFGERWPVPDDGLTNEQLDAVAEHLRATGQAKG